jgi:hypothetical protein
MVEGLPAVKERVLGLWDASVKKLFVAPTPLIVEIPVFAKEGLTERAKFAVRP